ncbi:MAG: hypothetical protein ACR2P0_07390 [Acidimicrobiales bacterium]
MRELAQTFRFGGVTSDRLAEVLATAPMVGSASIFGNRTTKSTSTEGNVRRAIGFEPAPIPLLCFDVEMTQQAADNGLSVVLDFTQPARRNPYLAGQFVWFLEDDSDGALLREEINTPAALEIVGRPLHGSGRSLRRWLFFSGGHQRLMKDVVVNIEALLADPPGQRER